MKSQHWTVLLPQLKQYCRTSEKYIEIEQEAAVRGEMRNAAFWYVRRKKGRLRMADDPTKSAFTIYLHGVYM